MSGDDLTGRPLRFVGGKGGVGKTTTAAALATAFAAEGHRTLLVSTDPAHSTSDLFGVALGDRPTVVAERCEVVEIDAGAAAEAHVEQVRRDAHRLVSHAVRATVDRHLDLARQAAGTLESAALDRLAELLVDRAEEYHRVVVDTAPTGHTLRLLAMPELLQGWIGGLVQQRERARGLDRAVANLTRDDDPPDDPVIGRLRRRAERLSELHRRLRDDATIHLVTLAERLALAETARADVALREAGLHVGATVVNMLLPPGDDPFLTARREQQRRHLDQLEGVDQVRVPLLAHDVVGLDDLAQLREHLAPLLAGGHRPGAPGRR